MAWIRLSDDYNDHPKFFHLSDGAFRLWHQGMGFCRKFQTDGRIPTRTLKGFHAYSPKRMKELLTPWMPDAAPLWEPIEGFGVNVHDYLDWNLSREDEDQQREESKHRMALGRDPELKRLLRLRDGEQCRYCARVVSWSDRRGPGGATYDHVDPRGGDGFDNIVISCRGCNSAKGRRTPTEANMILRPAPRRSRSVSRFKSESNSDVSGVGRDPDRILTEKESEEKLDALELRAGKLREELYPCWYAKYRHGARLRLIVNSLEFQDAMSLVQVWDDARLEKLAKIVLTTDDPWIANTDRGFKIFALKASWADDRLKAWEAERGIA